MKALIKSIAVLLAVSTISLRGALVVNGDFSAEDFDGYNIMEIYRLDAGWGGTLNGNRGNFNISTGEAVATVGEIDSGWWMAQVNTVGSESGSIVRISFDWTAAVGATGADLDVLYSLGGYTTTSGAATDVVDFGLANNGGLTMRTAGTEADFTAYDLSSDTTGSTINVTPEQVAFTGIAGVTLAYSFDLDLSSNIVSGITDVSQLDFFVIAFGSGDIATAGGVLDNVFVSAVPEPSIYALFSGFLGLTYVMVRRRS